MDTLSDKIGIRMSPRELELFKRSLAGKHCYLEFGCGGSTELAVMSACEKIVSVESDLNWIKHLTARPLIAEAMRNNRLRFEHVDIGPAGDWGFPKDDSKIRNWPYYFLTPFLKYPLSYDFILVDGRFRKACAYASYHFMDKDAFMAVHDYQLRYHYSEIEKFFNLVDEVDSLVILRKKEKIVYRNLYVAVLSSIFEP
jgi:hypothetical protein